MDTKEEQQQSRAKKALWIMLSVLALFVLLFVIQMVFMALFSNSVHELWDGAAEQLGEPIEAP